MRIAEAPAAFAARYAESPALPAPMMATSVWIVFMMKFRVIDAVADHHEARHAKRECLFVSLFCSIVSTRDASK
jgi:hypothetical protein